MKARPILFSAPMVKAILSGSKTQTRRVVKGLPLEWLAWDAFTPEFVADPANGLCPYGVPGDRLWVREAFHPDPPIDSTWSSTAWHGCPEHAQLADIPERYRLPKHCIYRADWAGGDLARWRPSIHMPRWASRLLLEVTDVRVERLQDISEADAVAEGAVDGMEHDDSIPFNDGYFRPGASAAISAVDAYRELWGQINGPGSWDANPWVWCVSFKRIEEGKQQ